jgi:uncharacterized membrane protein YgaE (UPF0421/DUF939 family)
MKLGDITIFSAFIAGIFAILFFSEKEVSMMTYILVAMFIMAFLAFLKLVD